MRSEAGTPVPYLRSIEHIFSLKVLFSELAALFPLRCVFQKLPSALKDVSVFIKMSITVCALAALGGELTSPWVQLPSDGGPSPPGGGEVLDYPAPLPKHVLKGSQPLGLVRNNPGWMPRWWRTLGSREGMDMVRHVWGQMPKSGVWCDVGLQGSSLHLQLPERFLCG